LHWRSSINRNKHFSQRDTTRVNNQIRVPKVRLVVDDGSSPGIVDLQLALQKAEEAGLDLVEIAPSANPPVCRVMDYGKFKYEKSKKAKDAKKKQHIVHLKEIKMRLKIDDHDYNFKKEHARSFLLNGDRVKATVIFRGREIAHIEFGERLLERLDKDLDDLCSIEIKAKREGRNLISMYVPDKTKIQQYNRKLEQEKKALEQEDKE